MDKESKEKMDELIKLAEEKNSEFAQRLEGYDRWRRSRRSIESATNWMLAINLGTLFLLVGSFGKFIVSDVMPIKPLFLLSAFFLGFSGITLAFFRAVLYLREFGVNKALEDLQGLPDRVRLNIETKTKEELKETVERIGKRSVVMWSSAHNLIPRFLPLIISGLAFYVLGVLLLAIYVVTFIVKYL
ncbi:hypothetical protein ES703_11379 [subsurface metagenome]